MAKFNVRFQKIHKGIPPAGTFTTTVTASNMWEARQVFKYNHIDIGTMKYKIIAVVKIGN
jgi:hypothetical protein